MTRWILTLAMALMPAVAQAQFTTMPNPLITWFGLAGLVLDDGGLCVFRAGTSTLATTYTTAGGGTANANPVRFNASGRATSGGVFLTPGQSYKFVLKDFTGVAVPTCIPDSGVTIFSVDNVEATPSSSAAVDVTATAGESIGAGEAVYLSTGAGGLNAAQLYKTDADVLYKSTGAVMIGIAPNAITGGATGTMRIMGEVSVTGPVLAGQPYYVDATPGAIVTTPPTNAIRIGMAASTSSIVVGYTEAPVSPRGPPCGRLTLTSGVPVTSADVTAATTVYYTPYGGCNQVSLFDGTAWSPIAFAQVSIAVPATTSQMYDVFGYDNAGVFALELNATSRTDNTGLTLTNGAYLKTGALTRLYLGSFRTTGVSGQTEDSAANRLLWNYFNRVPRTLQQNDTTANWPYTLATWRQQRATAANQVTVVIGVAEVRLSLTVRAQAANDTGGVNVSIGIGEDSTTAPVSAFAVGVQGITAGMVNVGHALTATLNKMPAVGYHFYTIVEASSAAGTTTWLGASSSTAANTNATGTGIGGSIDG